MKVLHFYKTYYPDEYGGVQRVIHQLAEGGRAFGVEADVLALSANATKTIFLDHHRVHRRKRLFKVFSTDVSFRVLADFKRLAAKADLIHYHFPWPLADVAHFFSAHGKPSLVTYHSDIVAQKRLLFFYRPLMNRFLRSVSAIITTSPNYIASSPVLKLFAEKTRCIPLGLSPKSAIRSELLENWRKCLPERFFLFIGFFRYYKGLDFLFAAIRDLPIPVVLVGEGESVAALKSKKNAEKLNNIHFVGALSNEDKEALLCLCYGLILPSHLRSEAFGLSLLEAAMHSKPLISCEIGTGTTYVNIHGETGLVASPADPASLRAAMLAMWEDEALVARLGAAARRRYEALFTGDKMVRAYVELYEELLKGQSRERG